jgi:competence ComEA-like helix-hairpin-helix protein
MTQHSAEPKRSVRFGWYMAAASFALATSIATTAAGRQDQKTKPDQAPAEQEEELARIGEETTDRVCSECHPIDDVTGRRRTARDWNNVVTDMVTRGANATDDEFAIIKRYLTRYFGIVSVNTASAEELSAVLGLSAKDASAIVEYRKTHGKFADAEALSKVPGIDKSKIEAQPDALRFD